MPNFMCGLRRSCTRGGEAANVAVAEPEAFGDSD